MTTQSVPETQSASDDSRLRVVLLLEVKDGEDERFLEAYEKLRHQVASVPGHIKDQLCQSIENPSQWLITSEWESAPPFLAWVDSPEHREMVKPMHGCVNDTRSLRFHILRETTAASSRGSRASTGAPAGGGRARAAKRAGGPQAAAQGGPQAAGRQGPPMGRPDADGVIRHALTFTVKPGSEQKVAEILANYQSPAAQADQTTRLLRTSLFMRANRVVRAIEVTGDLGAALRHVAAQPEVRAVEEAINPYLEEARDLDNPESARAFFGRAALPSVHHLAVGGQRPGKLHRHALLYPVRKGKGADVVQLLKRQDELETSRRSTPVAASTIFHRDDTVVRLVDLRAPLEQAPAVAAGVSGPGGGSALSRLIDLRAGDLSSDAGIRSFLAAIDMTPVTDRRSPDA